MRALKSNYRYGESFPQIDYVFAESVGSSLLPGVRKGRSGLSGYPREAVNDTQWRVKR